VLAPWRAGNSKGISLLAVLAGLTLFTATVLMLGQGFNYVVRTRRTAQVKNGLTDIEDALMMGVAQRVRAHALSCTSNCSASFLTTFNDGVNNSLPGIGVFTASSSPEPSVPNSSSDQGIYSFQVALQENPASAPLTSPATKTLPTFKSAENHFFANSSVFEVVVRIIDSSEEQLSQLKNTASLAKYADLPESFYYLMSYQWTLSKDGNQVFVQKGLKKVVP
jgi:hypothetical protein